MCIIILRAIEMMDGNWERVADTFFAFIAPEIGNVDISHPNATSDETIELLVAVLGELYRRLTADHEPTVSLSGNNFKRSAYYFLCLTGIPLLYFSTALGGHHKQQVGRKKEKRRFLYQ